MVDNLIIDELKAQYKGPTIICDVWVDVVLYRKNMRQDGSNIEQTIYDTLQSAEIIKNDRQAKKRTAIEFRSNVDRYVVKIYEYPISYVEIPQIAQEPT